jgi:hypothetical protein
MQGSSLQTFTPVADPKETSSILQTGSVYHAQQGTWVETEPMEINWRLGLSLQAVSSPNLSSSVLLQSKQFKPLSM